MTAAPLHLIGCVPYALLLHPPLWALGIEPKVSHMLGKCSTTEQQLLHVSPPSMHLTYPCDFQSQMCELWQAVSIPL